MNKTVAILAGLTLLLNACGDKTLTTGTQVSGDQSMAHDMHMPNTQLKTLETTCGTTDVAFRKAATASATENNFPASAAVDGDLSTRWSTPFSDPQWLQINLGSSQQICKLELQWESAYGKAFEIQVSDDTKTWTSIYSTTTGTGGNQTVIPTGKTPGKYLRMYGTKRSGGYGYSLLEFKAYSSTDGTVVTPPTSGAGFVMADPPVTGVVPSRAQPPSHYHHEFQAHCAVSRSTLPDDPIIYFGKPGASHMHTFLGNTTTNANTTTASLQAGSTFCSAGGDKSAYWMPTMYNGTAQVLPVGEQVIYYKAGVLDYTSVRPFPTGLRFVAGNMNATPDEFINGLGAVEGWECGDLSFQKDFPANCPAGSQVNIRFQSPSCWDGLHLDTPDHKSHMAYPVGWSSRGGGYCPSDHPVALPMLEFKMAFPVSGDMSAVRLASGRGYSFHYDFFNAWDPATLKALVGKCINGGYQCNERGFDIYRPESPAVLNAKGLLP
jgi:Domain of unknown function (DUF1996)/F5/8 type C domain